MNELMKMPDFLSTHTGEDTLGLVRQHVILPRVKVIQPLARPPYKPPFNDRDVILSPLMQLLAEGPEVGETLFHFVPLFFYPEWITWNPRGAGGLRAIRDRTLDPRHPIAAKSRSPETRKEKCLEAPMKDGQHQMMRHLEHLNYVFTIVGDHELAGFPMTMSFASGEHQAGSRFSTLISMRRSKFIYGLQFAAKLGQRTNDQGTWWGIDVDNPAVNSGVSPFVQDRNAFEGYAKGYAEMKEAYDQKRLSVNLEDVESPDEDVSVVNETRF